jgi:hypothetical protein
MKVLLIFIATTLLICLAKRQLLLFEWAELESVPCYSKEDTEPFKGLESNLVYDLRFLQNYSTKLFFTGQFEKVDSVLDLIQKRKVGLRLLNYQGDTKMRLKDTSMAINFYQKAVFMVPNRFTTKSKLMEVYLLKKDSSQAQIWARSILDTEVKIRSPDIDTLRLHVKTLFPNLSKF